MEINCGASLDRIGELPSNLIEIILMFLPLRDMVRTSILSKNWRFRWAKVPQLIFEDDPMFQQRKGCENEMYNMNIVFGILLQHHGPIRKFKFDISSWCSNSGIDKIIHFLSRNGIQELNFVMPCEEFHKLPSSIFSCAELKSLSLHSCSVKPLTLGFERLVTLELLNVRLGLYVLICDCPVLQYLTLEPRSFLVSLDVDAPNLKSLVTNFSVGCLRFVKSPPLENLCMSGSTMSKLAAEDSPNELPTILNQLRTLRLTSVDFTLKDQILSVLKLIRIPPNLQKLEFTEHRWPLDPRSGLQILYPCQYTLTKLREVKVELANDSGNCIEFCKFLLSVSPELETLYIKPASIDLRDCKTLLKLTCTRRASQKAGIIFIGLDLDN